MKSLLDLWQTGCSLKNQPNKQTNKPSKISWSGVIMIVRNGVTVTKTVRNLFLYNAVLLVCHCLKYNN